MKKIIASAVGLLMAGGVMATNASAFESQFGGFWRTRIYYTDNFTYDKLLQTNDTGSHTYMENRTRLFYTAKFNDDFKFVNKFEFNTEWGDKNGGDIGADGKGIWRVKNSYADFNLGSAFNVKAGIQPVTIARGMIFDDDFSGAIVTGKFGNVTVPLVYAAVEREDTGYFSETPAGKTDRELMAGMANIAISDKMAVTPYLTYYRIAGEETDVYYGGADVDMTLDPVKIFGTFIYNFGQLKDQDVNAFAVVLGADAGIAHGQVFYVSGDDDAKDDEVNSFVNAPGQSFYWAEILGGGIFDYWMPTNSSNTAPTNVMAANGGVTFKPMDKLSLTGDVWYATLAEDNAYGDTELGWEFDGKASYKIYDNLTADFILAYLVSGDAMGDENVMEGGLNLSLKF